MNQEFLRKIYDKMSPETQVKAKKIVKKYGKRKTESVDTKKKVPEFVPAKLKKADDITVAAILNRIVVDVESVQKFVHKMQYRWKRMRKGMYILRLIQINV